MQNFIIFFFGFFLVSRFFSEILRVIPKWVDVFDMPIILLLLFFSFFRYPNLDIDQEEHRHFVRSVFALCIIIFVSSLVNLKELFEPAALLFAVGILSGPFLVIILNKFVDDVQLFPSQIYKLFVVLFFINIIIVSLIDIPRFQSTLDPDVFSGTFGLNAYQFSIFLIISGGLILGKFVEGKVGLVLLICSHVFIFFTFVLLQYRAALPFFISSYALMCITLFGRKILKSVVIGSVILLFFTSIIYLSIIPEEGRKVLKYDSWIYILQDPGKFLKYGKFQGYPQTAKLIKSSPVTALVGVGPGNFMSRAYNTFGEEYTAYKKSKKGVGNLIQKWFGLKGPRQTSVNKHYLGKIKGEVVLGTYQLSNPNSSYLAIIAEIGLVGGAIIFMLYLYVFRRSLKLIRIAKTHCTELLPFATALVGSISYLIQLAFLENYWEMTRATLPVWLLFWITSAGIFAKLHNKRAPEDTENADENMIIPR